MARMILSAAPMGVGVLMRRAMAPIPRGIAIVSILVLALVLRRACAVSAAAVPTARSLHRVRVWGRGRRRRVVHPHRRVRRTE